MFRSLVKQLAHAHGYLATFMPKPFLDMSGSGFHTHYSLWAGGKNIFADAGRLNQTGRYFVGGLQKRMAETALCGSATPNGFLRRKPYTFCPINTSWGPDNRTVGIRIIEGKDSAVRVEKRDAGADCNPYLLLATDIAAGLDGIEQKIEPTEMTTGDAYSEDRHEPIPTDIAVALKLARGSDFMRSVLGDDMCELYIQQSEREMEFRRNQVTQVELDRYIGNF
ncbi:MAG: hypothetical protein Q8K28_22590 [Hoeflea sp.]|uniref:hypothetical protein n=1 Tax=Hoeflea sp. TaxID=1940281 RepID=UPI002730944D|nr:hypothetical protein [Hoeflea sp.]MDP2122699.1 hypothetical protein [Hoeflea sp.]